jgi:hypothetical protein
VGYSISWLAIRAPADVVCRLIGLAPTGPLPATFAEVRGRFLEQQAEEGGDEAEPERFAVLERVDGSLARSRQALVEVLVVAPRTE